MRGIVMKVYIRIFMIVAATSAVQAFAYHFEVINLLDVQIKVELPLVAELKSPEVITIPAKGTKIYDPQGWYAGYCLAVKNIKVAKEGAGFVTTPLQWVTSSQEDLDNMLSTVANGNGKVNVGLVENFKSGTDMYCSPIIFYIVEDISGKIFAIYAHRGYKW
jgi:hypothetical protein